LHPDATNTSGIFCEFRKLATARCVGVPSPLKIPYTPLCSTSWCTSDDVVVGL